MKLNQNSAFSSSVIYSVQRAKATTVQTASQARTSVKRTRRSANRSTATDSGGAATSVAAGRRTVSRTWCGGRSSGRSWSGRRGSSTPTASTARRSASYRGSRSSGESQSFILCGIRKNVLETGLGRGESFPECSFERDRPVSREVLGANAARVRGRV